LRSGQLAGLTMGAAIIQLSWPILIESLLNSFVGLTDTVLAAQISAAATDAIGGASYCMWFVGLIAMAIGIGATALISRAVGAGRMAVAHAATGQTMLLCAAGGALCTVLVALLAAPASKLLNLSPDAARDFVTFMRVVSLGIPGISMLAGGIACARGAGDSVRPLIAMVVVNIVNMFVSFALVGVDLKITRFNGDQAITRTLLNNPFPFDLGVAGIAWGTVIGEYVGLLTVVLILARGWAGVRLKLSRLLPHRTTMGRMLKVGIPSFFETCGMWLGNFAIIVIVGWLSLSGAHPTHHGGLLGSHIVAIRIESFSYLPGFAMGTAAATLVGQYLGAGSPLMARRAILRCTLVTVAIMGVLGAAFCLVPRTITGWISGQPEHLETVPKLLFITGLVQIPFGIGIILRSALRGAGDARPVMLLTWISTYLIRLPLVYVLSGVDIPLPNGGVIKHPFFDEPSLSRLWIALCFEIVMRAVLMATRFFHGGWMHVRV
jgi:putative MATE family efflux protein